MPNKAGHYHAWELNDSGWHWLGTWATFEEMDSSLDDPGFESLLVIDNVDPCDCPYGVGMGEPKEDTDADTD